MIIFNIGHPPPFPIMRNNMTNCKEYDFHPSRPNYNKSRGTHLIDFTSGMTGTRESYKLTHNLPISHKF